MAHGKAPGKLHNLPKMVSITVSRIPSHMAVAPKAQTVTMQFDSSQMVSDVNLL